MTSKKVLPFSGRPYKISNVAGIRLLASATRQSIVDTFVASGPLTIAQLGRLLGRPSDRLYYHVKLLVRAGLLVASDGSSPNGRKEARFDVPGRPMSLWYDTTSGANRRAIGRVVKGMIRAADDDFRKAFAARDVETHGPRRNLWASRAYGHMTSSEVAAANRLLGRLLKLINGSRRSPSRRTRLHQLTWIFSPHKDA